jgi:hypothetical protein
MGKAARNEVKKLTATYFNNIAVALFVAGLAIPLISARQNDRRRDERLFAVDHGIVTTSSATGTLGA